MTIGPRTSGSMSANPITTKYRSGDVFETAAISARAGVRVATQGLRLAGEPVRLIVAGIGVAGQKVFCLNPAQTEDFTNLLLCQTIFPVAFGCDRFQGKTLGVSVFGASQSPSDFIRDFERQNHALAYRAPDTIIGFVFGSVRLNARAALASLCFPERRFKPMYEMTMRPSGR